MFPNLLISLLLPFFVLFDPLLFLRWASDVWVFHHLIQIILRRPSVFRADILSSRLFHFITLFGLKTWYMRLLLLLARDVIYWFWACLRNFVFLLNYRQNWLLLMAFLRSSKLLKLFKFGDCLGLLDKWLFGFCSLISTWGL